MMEANPGKFQVMILHRFKSPSDFVLALDGADLKVESSVKLLEVNTDVNLNFKLHFKMICRKAGAQLNALFF